MRGVAPVSHTLVVAAAGSVKPPVVMPVTLVSLPARRYSAAPSSVSAPSVLPDSIVTTLAARDHGRGHHRVRRDVEGGVRFERAGQRMRALQRIERGRDVGDDAAWSGEDAFEHTPIEPSSVRTPAGRAGVDPARCRQPRSDAD